MALWVILARITFFGVTVTKIASAPAPERPRDGPWAERKSAGSWVLVPPRSHSPREGPAPARATLHSAASCLAAPRVPAAGDSGQPCRRLRAWLCAGCWGPMMNDTTLEG